MTREEVRQKLLAGEYVYCEYLMYNNLKSFCDSTLSYWNGEGDYECCNNDYENVEEMLDAIEYECKGDWSEVF